MVVRSCRKVEESDRLLRKRRVRPHLITSSLVNCSTSDGSWVSSMITPPYMSALAAKGAIVRSIVLAIATAPSKAGADEAPELAVIFSTVFKFTFAVGDGRGNAASSAGLSRMMAAGVVAV